MSIGRKKRLELLLHRLVALMLVLVLGSDAGRAGSPASFVSGYSIEIPGDDERDDDGDDTDASSEMLVLKHGLTSARLTLRGAGRRLWSGSKYGIGSLPGASNDPAVLAQRSRAWHDFGPGHHPSAGLPILLCRLTC